MNYSNLSIMLGGISLVFFPISLMFKTTIIYFFAKSIGLGFALGAGYFSTQAIKNKDKTIGIISLNLAVIDLIIHLMPF